MDLPDYQVAFGKLRRLKTAKNMIILNEKQERKVPSIEGLGVGCSSVGRHPGHWIIDDVVDRRKAVSEIQTRDIRDWWKHELLPSLGPDQKVTVIGTRWRFNDMYGDILDDNKKLPESEQFKVILIPALNEQNESYWPQVWPVEALLAKKREVGPYSWQSQFMNNPALQEGALFKLEWIHHWSKKGESPDDKIWKLPPQETLKIIQGWDLASSTKSRSDYTVGVTAGIDGQNHFWILNITRGQWSVPTAIKLIQHEADAWHPIKIGVESNAFQMTVPQELRERGQYPVVEVHQSQDKILRINELAPYFENGTIRVGLNEHDFENEYQQFPLGAHDDIMDALHITFTTSRQLMRRRAYIIVS